MTTQTHWNDTIRIHNPKKLSAGRLPVQRVPIGVPGDYKPCVAQLSGGELLLVAFHQHPLDRTRKIGGTEVQLLREDALLFRSMDGGQTWSEPEVLPFVGREPYFTILSESILLLLG